MNKTNPHTVRACTHPCLQYLYGHTCKTVSVDDHRSLLKRVGTYAACSLSKSNQGREGGGSWEY